MVPIVFHSHDARISADNNATCEFQKFSILIRYHNKNQKKQNSYICITLLKSVLNYIFKSIQDHCALTLFCTKFKLQYQLPRVYFTLQNKNRKRIRTVLTAWKKSVYFFACWSRLGMEVSVLVTILVAQVSCFCKYTEYIYICSHMHSTVRFVLCSRTFRMYC